MSSVSRSKKTGLRAKNHLGMLNQHNILHGVFFKINFPLSFPLCFYASCLICRAFVRGILQIKLDQFGVHGNTYVMILMDS